MSVFAMEVVALSEAAVERTINKNISFILLCIWVHVSASTDPIRVYTVRAF